MKKRIFWILYAVFAITLVALGVWLQDYVKGVLKAYEAAQPEVVVEQQLEKIKAAAAEDTLEDIISFAEIKQAAYDIDFSAFREYKDKLKNAKELTYKIKNGYSETEQQFHILADEEIVAVLTLESVKEEIKLAILKVNEWRVKDTTPVLTLTHYDYIVDVPAGFQVTINGTGLSNPQKAENGWDTYVVETLYSEPEIKIYDAHGKEALYDIVDNHVTPIVHTYSLKLPQGFSVSAGGKVQEGVTVGEEIQYSITTLYETLELTDAYGHRMEYKGGDSIYTYDYKITIPSNFKISVNGSAVEGSWTEIKENSKYQYPAEYAKMPGIATYEIKNSLYEPEVEIYDNLDQKVECVFENYAFEVTEQAALSAVPEEIAAQVDVLEVAKIWSNFLTRDLTGSQNGFGTVKQYFITDSYYYNVAYQYAVGVDITFMFGHLINDPPYTEESVTNFISYGENLFSCDIHFIKHMYAKRDTSKKDVTDTTNSTFYFLKYDETDDGVDNGRWVILDIQEIISE